MAVYLISKGKTLMKPYKAENIKNIAVIGHGGKGKTTLCEAMLYTAGATDRLGAVSAGTAVLDYDDEEKKRGSSVSAALASIEWDNTKLNILDVPGLFDFENSQVEALRAVETALIVTSAGSGVDVGTEKAVKAAGKNGLKRVFAITKTDSDHRSFFKTYDALKERWGATLCPTVVPYMEGNLVKSYVNFITDSAYEYNDGKSTKVAIPDDPTIAEMHEAFMESVASADEELMEKYFGGEKFTEEEIIKGFREGIEAGLLIPVLAVAGPTCGGVDQLLNGLAWTAPTAKDDAGEIATDESGEMVEIPCDENGSLAAICFKTVSDAFIGKLSFVKVVGGILSSDTPAYNMRTGENEKIGKIVTLKGDKQEEMKEIVAGDIGVLTKLSALKTGDTLCSPKAQVTLDGVATPRPCLSMAVKVRKKGDEDKVASALTKLIEEDPSISYVTNKETKEQILSGLGEQHLDVIVSKLKNRFNVEVDLTVPKVAYRETIPGTAKAQGKYKKQSGGHGQYGDVWVRFEPCVCDGLEFTEEVVGGSVPKNFFPAVEKGLQESVREGVLAGYPMVGVRAVLYDGSYHPVDSSEMAFKAAASMAYKAGIINASPVILEPVGTLKVLMPDDKLGTVMGDVTKRRGRVLGMGPTDDPKVQELIAEVPMAEMNNFSTVLRSTTAGRGYFEFDFTRYEEAPKMVADKVIADYKASKQDEE